MRLYFSIVLIIICFSFTGKINAQDSTYINQYYNFSFKIDSNWQEIPFDTLIKRGLLKLALNDSASRQDLITGFSKKKSNKIVSFPLILLISGRSGKIIESDLTNFDTLPKNYFANSPDLNKTKISDSLKFLYDAKNRIIWASSGERKVFRQIMGSHLTNSGFIRIICFSGYDDYLNHETEFKNIIRSVKLEKEIQFDVERRRVQKRNEGRGTQLIFTAIFFSVILYLSYRKKYKKKKMQ